MPRINCTAFISISCALRTLKRYTLLCRATLKRGGNRMGCSAPQTAPEINHMTPKAI